MVEKNDDDIMSSTAEQLSQLGIQPHTKPIEPICATYECRLKTFKGWPKHLKQTPESLAAAGFYYIGIKKRPNIIRLLCLFVFFLIIYNFLYEQTD